MNLLSILTLGWLGDSLKKKRAEKVDLPQVKADAEEGVARGLFLRSSSPSADSAKFSIEKAEKLKANDWIIHNGEFFFVAQEPQTCMFMGSMNFGAVVYVGGFHKGSQKFNKIEFTIYLLI